MSDAVAKTPEQRRRAVMRTAWLLAAVAATVFSVFLYTAMHAK